MVYVSSILGAGLFVATFAQAVQDSAPNVERVVQWLRSQEYSEALKEANAMKEAQPHDCRAVSLRVPSFEYMSEQLVNHLHKEGHSRDQC